MLRWVFGVAVRRRLLPVVVAVVRAISRGWMPLSDDALFAVRSFDVFGHHVPLLGTWSSSSLSYGAVLNNPGPLQFDLLVFPVRLFGGSSGVAVGTALINVVVIVGIAIFAVRRGGLVLGTLAMAVTAGLCWTMGSESLFEPWQPVTLLLPFLCFLFLVWSISCGDLAALPVAAGIGSLILQTHLAYAFVVPTLAIWAVAGLVLKLRRDRRDDPDVWPWVRRDALRVAALAAAVGVVCWVQPVIDQLGGQGNLGHLIQNASPPKRTVGYGYGRGSSRPSSRCRPGGSGRR